MQDDQHEHAMYVPPSYVARYPRDIIAAYPFATLVTATPDGPFATWVPIYFETNDPDETRLVGHMARANPHASALRTGDPTLAIFSGPHAYISASWYRERPTVPTWNYLAAQVRGPLEAIDDDIGQLAILRRSAAMAERGSPAPWQLDHAPEGRLDMLLPRIRSFRLTIARIDAAEKLNQPQPLSDRLRVIEALEQRRTGDDLDIAGKMRALDGLPQLDQARP
jgi:transcriptional regulator